MELKVIENGNVLIVDDTPLCLDPIREYLNSSGFTTYFASSGEEMFQQMAQVRPDIILLDVLMPMMDGFEACRRIKSNEQTKDIPVIFMTALTDVVEKVKGFEAGAVDYVTKPFHPQEVLARIKTHLTIQRRYREMNAHVIEHSKRQMDELRWNINQALPHEFRTPLTAILGVTASILSFASTMSKDMIIDELQLVQTAAERLEFLIQNYVLYAQLIVYLSDPAKMAEMRARCLSDPHLHAQEVAIDRSLRSGRSADLHLEINEQPVSIHILDKHWHKLVQELIDNALKFSKPGNRIEIKTYVADGQFVLQLRDHGYGMSTEQISNIGAFMQFNRRFYEQQGSGLGLIIARNLVELYDGQFAIQSVLNEGTTVIIRFPAVQE